MKILINIVRFVVGLLFIFSGLVKANDPLGLSYKMQEFFERWNEDLATSSFFLKDGLLSLIDFFDQYSLALAVIMITFEIVAGIALILGWKWRVFSWLMLVLIIFFTFLTGYALNNPKFRNCGCFGDCIPITPQTSFYKDLILLALIVFLFAFRKHVVPFFTNRTNALVMLVSTLLTLAIQWYTLSYMPFADCLPFKKGNNIEEQTKIPPNAEQDIYDIKFVYSKNGKEYEFGMDQLPSDLETYTFVDQKKKLVKKGKNNEPKIAGFVLKGVTGYDSTSIILNHPFAVLLLSENFDTPVSKWSEDFRELVAAAEKKNIPVYILSASMDNARRALSGTAFSHLQILTCDHTPLRSAARVNPTVYILKEGTVLDKKGYREFDEATQFVNTLPINAAPPPPINSTDSTNLP